MPFFQVDDQLSVSRKTQSLIENEGPLQGGSAIGLWTLAGSLAQAKGSDGVVTTGDLVRQYLDRAKALKAAKLLVKYRLWHAHGHDCDRCPPVAEGEYLFHDWFAMGYTPAEKVRQNRDKRKELKNNEIIDAVWARDGEHCRYCRRHVKRGDRKSPNRPTLDHVYPGVARGPGNLVVACLPCNQKKGQRTPEQAGMPLVDTPSYVSPPAGSNRSDQIAAAPDSDLISAGPHRGRAGSGAGVGSDPGTGSGSGNALGYPITTPAGPAPDAGNPGRDGSPWANWTGPPVHDPPPESWCPIHQMHQPCSGCHEDFNRSEEP